MTVKELLERLAEMEPSRLVVLSADSEGNGYSPLVAVEGGHRYDDGEIGLEKLTPELRACGYGTEDVMRSGKRCVVLWP